MPITETRRLAQLTTAAEALRPVTITYECGKDSPEVEVRTIEIHSIDVTKAGDIVIRAYCQLRGEMRTFRLDRITRHRTTRRVWRGPQPKVTAFFSMFRASVEDMASADESVTERQTRKTYDADGLLAGVREGIATARAARMGLAA